MKTNQQAFDDLNKKGWPCCYYGDHPNWFQVIGQSRDSRLLEQSNYHCILKALKKISEDDVIEERASHWACGYIDEIIVNPKNKELVKCAEEILNALENYPIIDEDNFSELKYEECVKYWNNMLISERIREIKNIVKQYHCKIPRSFIPWFNISYYTLGNKEDEISQTLYELIQSYVD